ncbi:MAG: Gfo/Idh/MocA family oxidoreductase [Oscillospiraceae bacterium]|jgi:predicted dehydrogenase|nr:Gfo/Idh/MocA family oxidoreductase [Oscillospiraceae bacterium]
MDAFNIGIVGTGWIAEKMALTVNEMSKSENVRLAAVGSRRGETAAEFAERFGVPKACASYGELCADGGLDLVYIATPHAFHYENMLLALNAGKNVLCEKPFTVNAKQARSVIGLAAEKDLFIAEAIWTRYLPLREKFSLISGGAIGKPLSLTAELSYPNAGIKRMYDLDLAGGALLDLGVYPINFALAAFGSDIVKIESKRELFPTGADRENEIVFTYADGKTAKLESSLSKQGDNKGIITGTGGRLIFENINNYERAELHDGRGVTRFERPPQITGYEYQVRACAEAIGRGGKECREMPRSEIIRVMEIMDEIRGQWGLVYPFE